MILSKKLLNILLLQFLSWSIEVRALFPLQAIMRQQISLSMELIKELHKIYEFDNFIIYRRPRRLNETKSTNFLKLRNHDKGKYFSDEIIKKSVERILYRIMFSPDMQMSFMSFTISPSHYVNNTKAIPNLGNILTNKNVALVILNNFSDFQLREFVVSSLGASLETKIVFLLHSHEITNVSTFVRLEKLNTFFRWCWSKNILNVVLLFQETHIGENLQELKLEAYTYSPFLSHKLIRLTGQNVSQYFQQRIANVFGFELKTPVISDKPLVFKSPDLFTGIEIVTGISGKIYMEYVEHINATFKELKSEKVGSSWVAVMDYIYELLEEGIVDISIQPITALVPNKFFLSYPIRNINNCIVVPVKQEIFPGLYIPRTLTLEMWFLWLVLFLAFQLVYMLINYDNYGQMRPWLAFATTLKGLLNMPVDNMGVSSTISMNSLSCRRKIWMHMLLLLTGMIFFQSHIAALSSFLSSTLYPEQIESPDDLVKANLSIMMVDYIYNMYKYVNLIPDNFSQNVIIATADNVSYHLNQWDTRYAYTVYSEEWRVIHFLQRYLSKPLFKIVPQLCIPNVYLNLPMQFNSPFYGSFKMFIQHSQSAGLDIKWSDMIYEEIQKGNGLNASTMKNLEKPPNTFGLEYLTYILYIYIGGIIVAGVVFLIEVKLAHLSRKLQQSKRQDPV